MSQHCFFPPLLHTHTHTHTCLSPWFWFTSRMSPFQAATNPPPLPPLCVCVLGRLQSCIKGSLFESDRERKSALEIKTEGARERWRPQGCTSGVITRLPPACQENADIPAPFYKDHGASPLIQAHSYMHKSITHTHNIYIYICMLTCIKSRDALHWENT